MKAPCRVLLVTNAHSRHGRQLAQAARQALDELGCTIVDPEENPRDRPAELVRRYAGVIDAVAVVGGDGTLNAVAPALIETGLPLLVVPAGTANDLARTLQIPNAPENAVKLLVTGEARRIDVGSVNDMPFFNVASIGFGVDLTRALTRDSKRRWGVFGYAMAAARALRRLRPFTAWIKSGDIIHLSRTVHVAVGNGRHFGGGMTVAADARIDDCRLDAFSLEVSSLWGLLKLLPALRSGRHHRWTEVRTLAGEELEIRTTRPRSVNTDGEITAHTPAVSDTARRGNGLHAAGNRLTPPAPSSAAAGREPPQGRLGSTPFRSHGAQHKHCHQPMLRHDESNGGLT